MDFEKIEPWHRLGFTMEEASARRVAIAVPLDGNRNDKGTMFGGSVYCAMVLAGWRLCGEQAAEAGLAGDIVVRDSSVTFLRPVTGGLTAVAVPRSPPKKTPRGNYAFDISVTASDGSGKKCAEFTGGYRLLGKQPAEGME
jgi:thioesterase domain-containing protein